jgi:hypothetical protein
LIFISEKTLLSDMYLQLEDALPNLRRLRGPDDANAERRHTA